MNIKTQLLVLLFIILMASPTHADLNPPTVYEPGRILWGQYWDFFGQNGARNGSTTLSVYPPNFVNCTGFNSTGVNISQWNNTDLVCLFYPVTAATGGEPLWSNNYSIFLTHISNATAQILRSQVTGQENIDISQNTTIATANTTATIANITANNAMSNISANMAAWLNKYNVTTEYFTGDGITTNFTLTYNYISGSESVTLNGVRQKQGIIYIVILNNSINFTSAPPVSDEIGVQYEY